MREVGDPREPETEEYYEKQGRFQEDPPRREPTPGPWEASDQSVTGPRGISIAYCGQSMIADAGGSYCVDLEESRANARLCAAAPELLAALMAIREAFRSGQGMFVAQSMGERALKAVGK